MLINNFIQKTSAAEDINNHDFTASQTSTAYILYQIILQLVQCN